MAHQKRSHIGIAMLGKICWKTVKKTRFSKDVFKQNELVFICNETLTHFQILDKDQIMSIPKSSVEIVSNEEQLETDFGIVYHDKRGKKHE